MPDWSHTVHASPAGWNSATRPEPGVLTVGVQCLALTEENWMPWAAWDTASVRVNGKTMVRSWTGVVLVGTTNYPPSLSNGIQFPNGQDVLQNSGLCVNRDCCITVISCRLALLILSGAWPCFLIPSQLLCGDPGFKTNSWRQFPLAKERTCWCLPLCETKTASQKSRQRQGATFLMLGASHLWLTEYWALGFPEPWLTSQSFLQAVVN